MSVEHLSDYDIQEYLDNKKSDINMTAHLNSCNRCQEILRQYELCFSVFNQEIKSDLPINFSAKTMAVIKADSSFNDSSIGIYLCSFAGFIISIVVMGYVAGYESLLQLTGISAILNYIVGSTYIQSFTDMFLPFSNIIGILIFAAIIISFFAVLDKLVIKQKLSNVNCFSI